MDKQNQIKIVRPGQGNTLIDEEGNTLRPPAHWVFLPAGDAGITRKVSCHKLFWRVQIKKGKRHISKGIWAPAELIQQAIQEVTQARNTPEYEQKKAYTAAYRQKKETAYAKDFLLQIKTFLNFDPAFHELETMLAQQITQHAIPVGSGTVARTKQIPIAERAERATIAWMRHHTTIYDNMQIAHIKGERRKIRRMLAEESRKLLNLYRKGEKPSCHCPLWKAIQKNIPLQKKPYGLTKRCS